MKQPIRIPVFDKEFLFNVYEEVKLDKDEPDPKWIDQDWKPQRNGETIGSLYDPFATKELFRILQFGTCAYCRQKMINVNRNDWAAKIFYCTNCFYWGGRGTRPGGPAYNRANLGRLDFVSNPEDVNLDLLITHLKNNSNRLLDLTPKQAEKIIPVILSDYLACEVKAFGGTRDKGIDAIAIKGDNTKMLVQIKWREHKEKAENVAVVREVAGTLLARNIPSGLIISTRNKFSADAKAEARLINGVETVSMGKLHIALNDFNDIVDMFEVAAKIRKDKMTADEVISNYGFDLFGMI